MKKLLSLALALIMCCSTLSACAVETVAAAAPNNAENAADTPIRSGEATVSSAVKLASSAGTMEIKETYGTITLSSPILYTISVSDLGKIDMSSAEVIREGVPFDEVSAAEYASQNMWSKISAVYAIPTGTIITLPSGILTSTILQMDVTVENGVCRADQLNVSLFPGYDAIQAPEPEPAYIAVIELEYVNVPEKSTVTADGSGVSGSSPDDRYAGSIAFFVSEDASAENPFGSSVPAAPETPQAPATSSPTGNSGFTDVAADAYYFEPVNWAIQKSIASGMGDGLFSPDITCSTAHILTFLWRAKGSPKPTSTTNPFTDVQESDYYYKAALWAKENNVLPLPFNPAFQGDAPCTRGMAMLYIWRAAGFFAAEKSSGFADVPDTSLYAPAVDWAVENGVTTGMGDGTFGSEIICTRAQIITFLYRAFK